MKPVELTETQEPLYDDWRYRPEEKPDKLEWNDELAEGSSVGKARWGFLQLRRTLFGHLPGAYIIDRSDAVASITSEDFSGVLHTDLQVEWQGRTALFAGHAYLPRQSYNEWKRFGPQQGLDTPDLVALHDEYQRTGLPIFVVWLWQSSRDERVQIAGKRLDALGRPHSEALNRRRSEKGAKTHYWSLQSLLTIAEIADDLESLPFLPQQLTLDGE